mgnify:CR=1 FL=1
MSSLFKRSKWTLQYHDDDRSPSKKQFSLRTTNKRTATKLKAELDDLYQRGLFDPWTDDFRDRLEELKRPDKPKGQTSLLEAKQAFIESRQGLADRTVGQYELVTRLFTTYAGEAAIAAITPADVQAFLQSGDLSLTTKHSYQRHLSVFFRWCQDQSWISENPASKVRLQRKPDKRPKAFTREEVSKLVEKASGYLKPLIVLATRTGLRRSELSRLQWEDVDLIQKRLHVTGQTKSGKERTVPLPADAINALGSLNERRGYVFHLKYHNVRIHPDTFTHDFTDHRREVLPDHTSYSFHCLRHTFCTWLAEAGVPIHTIKELAGHSSIQTTMQYVHALTDGKEHVERVFGAPYEENAEAGRSNV